MKNGTKCSRCGNKIGLDWESGWPIYAKIEVGRSSVISRRIGSDIHKENFKKHPAVIKQSAQSATIQWHNQPLYPPHWDGLYDENAMYYIGKSSHPFQDISCHISWERYNKARKNDEFVESPYKLCYDCHDDFLQLLGVFLRFHNDTQRSNNFRKRDALTGLEK